MSDPKKQQQPQAQNQDTWNDAGELGPVDHVNDLAPDPDVGPARKAHEQERILKPSAAGYFEVHGGSAANLGAPLHLGSEIKKDGGHAIGQYEAGYNNYAQPLRSTLRAMGRLKDVSMTGAPLTPDELMKNPKFAARFGNLSLTKQSDANAQNAYQDWSSRQTKMQIDVQRFGAAQHEMASVVADYRRVQKMIEQRRTEMTRAKKASELHEIDEAAETLARVVDVSVEAWGAAGMIEEELARANAPLNEAAEGFGAIDDLPVNHGEHGIDWARGTTKDPYAREQPDLQLSQNKRQKVGEAVDNATDGTAMSRQIAKSVKEKMGTSTSFSLSMKDVFIVMMDKGPEYKKLEDDIKKLDGKIKSLGFDQEQEQIHSTSERMKGMNISFSAIRKEVRADRKSARAGAQVFGQTMGAGAEGVMAMYAAEVYPELSAFGTLADQQRRDMVDPLHGRVSGYLHGVDKHRFLAIGAAQDALTLNDNLQAVTEQRTFFAQHMPEWQKRAKQWSDFLGSKTGSSLVAKDNEADARSQAP